ncbi:MAG: arginine deiminase-related protein [Bacteroidota bacterium]
MDQHTTSNILMIRPANFGFNDETAANNSFQSKLPELSKTEIKEKAKAEFDTFVVKLRDKGVNVIVMEDTDYPVKPDAVFPNNWVSFHENAAIVTYPIFSPKRRLERRNDVLENLKADFEVERIIRLEKFEQEDMILEGTGSMIMDRVHKIAYACTSPRTNEALMDIFCKMTDYTKVVFQSVDANGEDIYHTNVMMAMGENFVIICLDTVKDQDQRQMLLDRFEATNKEVIEITFEQILSFAGNMLQVRNKTGDTFLVMSEQAYQSLHEEQIKKIEARTNILYSPIPTIETLGGGSTRCMMAEIFLPEKVK